MRILVQSCWEAVASSTIEKFWEHCFLDPEGEHVTMFRNSVQDAIEGIVEKKLKAQNVPFHRVFLAELLNLEQEDHVIDDDDVTHY